MASDRVPPPPPPPRTPASVSAEDLAQLSVLPGVCLVDVRPRRLYHRSHVPGSHSIPAGLLLAGELPEGDLVLIGDDSAETEAVITRLHELGYSRRIRYLNGGYPAWVALHPAGETRPWSLGLADPRQLLGGPALLIAAGLTQSLGLLGLGLVVLLGPWALARSRA
ncbi:rhodanese-like domain-containing protein [Synechococcus sp. GFB01]|uniref:rhodanese-like domain-containing protein n=1 Tax=Synechococcus sp. GFB01 TaxID=1662190 RepID=UPI001F172584|nr:rhodanese-like domain-containing protein [Synechococcus sp. GFB01]